MTKNIIISTHVWSDGPSQAMREFLVDNKSDFLWIGHPLQHSEKIDGSGYSIFKKGKETFERYEKSRDIMLPVRYFREIVLNVLYVIRAKAPKDSYYIGYDNLNALSGILLKKLGRVRKTIYYVVDFTPKRFPNKWLNTIYHKIDQFCVKHSDETWNLNEKAMNQGRKDFYHFDAYKKGCSLQREVPMGYWKKRIKIRPFEKINKKQIVFMGNIIEKQGVQFIIRALPQVVKEIPDIKLVVVGGGEYLDQLKSLAKSLKVDKNIKFTGFIDDLKDVEEILASSALAMAIYEEGNKETNFTYYADPGKIKNYLGCGLPILLSSVPTIAKEIEQKKCGFIISNDPTLISEKIIHILSNTRTLRLYRENVLKFREQFDWEIIFKKCMKFLNQ